MTTAIAKIQAAATRSRNGHAKVAPGQAARLPEAMSVGDEAWQGDLGLSLVDGVPRGYRRVEKPKAADAQLVPGTTQGARHCLSDVTAVDLYKPADWSADYDGLDGPVFVAVREVTVLHPTHGDVTVPAGFTIRCRYQREYDAELGRERRNAD